MNVRQIYDRARELGFRLEPRSGGRLAVIPGDNVPPDLVDVLMAHKGELLDWLADQMATLRPDEIPWLHVARQILAGEFHGADQSTRESLTIGLCGIRHPLCQQALIRLKGTD